LPPPDPTAAKLSPSQIGRRAYDACLITQARLQSLTREEVRGPCRCYADKTVAGMTRTEIAAFRETGYFDDSARAKALLALDECKLKRPI